MDVVSKESVKIGKMYVDGQFNNNIGTIYIQKVKLITNETKIWDNMYCEIYCSNSWI